MENKIKINEGDKLKMDGFLDFSGTPSYLVLNRKGNKVTLNHCGSVFNKKILLDSDFNEYIKMSKRTWLTK